MRLKSHQQLKRLALAGSFWLLAGGVQSVLADTIQPPITGTPTGGTTQPPITGTPTGDTTQPPITGTPTGGATQPPITGTPTGDTTQPPTTGTPTGGTTQPPTTGTPTGGTTPISTVSGCRENPLDGVFCKEGKQICIPAAAMNQPAKCTSIPGICIENPELNLFCDDFGGQICFPDAARGIVCGSCKEDPTRGLFCSLKGKPLCEERPNEGIFCNSIPPSCIHNPVSGLLCNAQHQQEYAVTCVPDPTKNMSCNADGQLCITTVAGRQICQNDFTMDNFDVSNYRPEQLALIDSEDEMGRLPKEFFAQMQPEAFQEFRDDAYGHMNSTQVEQLPPEVFGQMNGEEFFHFAPEVFQSFKPAQVQQMPRQAFAGLTAFQFNQLKPDALQAMNRNQVRNLPDDVWGSVDAEVFFNLPANALEGLDEEDCEQLPPSIFAKMGSNFMSKLGENCLEGMEEEDFALLPGEALGGLNADNLAGLPPRVVHDMTPDKFKKLQPQALRELRDKHPRDMLDMLGNMLTLKNDGISADEIAMVKDLLPTGIKMDPTTGEFSFADDFASDGTLPFPTLKVNPEDLFGDLSGRIKYAAPFDMNQGFGLGGAGRSGIDLLDEALRIAFPGFKFRQDKEGFIELIGEGEYAGAAFDLVVLNVKKAPKGTPPGVTTVPITGAYLVTTSNGMELELSFGAPNLSCLAKGLPNHEVEYTSENVMIFNPIATTNAATGRREDNGSTPIPGVSGGRGKGRRATQTPGLTTHPATQPGERPYGELVYASDIGIEDCAGFVQKIYPTLPNVNSFINLLVSSGFSKEDLFRHVNGGVRVRYDVDGNGQKELYEVVPDFPTEAPAITRGKVEQERLAKDANGKFVLDTLGRFIYKYPYNGKLLTIPLALVPVTE